MVKIKNPLISFDASGGLGDKITYSHRQGNKIVQKIAHPVDVKSLAQLSWRTMYQKATALWHALSIAEKRTWESAGTVRHMTGFAWFMSQCLRPNPGIYLPLAGGTMAGTIDMGAHAITDLPDPAAAQDADTKSARNAAITAALYTQGARVYNSANISIPNDTPTKVTFNSQSYDTDSIHSTITNPSRLTCNTTGKYIISFGGYMTANPNGDRRFQILLNNTTYIAATRLGVDPSGYTFTPTSTIFGLTAGDYVEAVVYQNSGGALNLVAATSYSPIFMMQKIG